MESENSVRLRFSWSDPRTYVVVDMWGGPHACVVGRIAFVALLTLWRPFRSLAELTYRVTRKSLDTGCLTCCLKCEVTFAPLLT